MGYALRIGEAVVDWDEDCVIINAEPVKLDDAPAFGEPTDGTNSRWPSYSSWEIFCRETGIIDVMMNDQNGGSSRLQVGEKWITCLMPTHPGCAPITETHLRLIEEKIGEYKAKHPDHCAEYPPLKPGARPIAGSDIYLKEDYVDDPKYDGNLCRAEWLLFWIRWALKNCRHPVFVNS